MDKLPKLPKEVWSALVGAFFDYGAVDKTIGASFYFSAKKGWKIIVPSQVVSSCTMSSSFLRSRDLMTGELYQFSSALSPSILSPTSLVASTEEPYQFPGALPPLTLRRTSTKMSNDENYDFIGDAYSHNSMPPFFSSTTDRSELKIPGYYLSVGSFSRDSPSYQVMASKVKNGRRATIPAAEILEDPLALPTRTYHSSIRELITTVVLLQK